MKIRIACFVLITALTGCSGNMPKGLASESCDCWQEMKALQNETAQARKADECTLITQRALSDLREMGVDKGWNGEQVNQAQKEFDSIYNSCK